MRTSRDFPFLACHKLPGRSRAAWNMHWHSYVVTFTSRHQIDQDLFVASLCAKFKHLHGSCLNDWIEDSTDEELARWFKKSSPRSWGIVSVVVHTDGQRHAHNP